MQDRKPIRRSLARAMEHSESCRFFTDTTAAWTIAGDRARADRFSKMAQIEALCSRALEYGSWVYWDEACEMARAAGLPVPK